MKRYVHASSFQKIDYVKFITALKQELSEVLSDNAVIQIQPQYDMIRVSGTDLSTYQFKTALADAVSNAGYSVYMFLEYNRFAAVSDNDAWASIEFLHVDWEDMFEVYVNCDHGTVLLEDWW